jgi:peroxiredoxin Q/BCP
MKWEMTSGQFFSLSEQGEEGPFVLYFYPRDNTAGCSQEAADFAALHKKFRGLGLKIFGVSTDTLASHEKFKAKLKLPFELVSDPEQTLSRKFDVIKMKSLYGRKFEGIERSTFLVGKKGKILAEWRKVKVPGHADTILAAARELK